MAGLLVPMGTLGDRIGYRKLMLTGLAIFALASVCAAFSPSALLLIVSRALLALGAAMIIPSVLAIVRQTFEDPKERAIALGIWTTVGSGGAAMGPLIGGGLLEHFWWGSVFLINVPIMLAVLPTVYVLLPNRAVHGAGGWKVGQAALLIAGLLSTVFAVKTGFRPGASIVLTACTLLSGVALLAGFGRLQLTARDPMLDLTLFLRPAISVGMATAFVVSGALAGFELLLA